MKTGDKLIRFDPPTDPPWSITKAIFSPTFGENYRIIHFGNKIQSVPRSLQ
uniref:Uncharacterized protein n=1 Tax=Anguilla anguilla TaxID=7936 RepID=A0A0E9UPT7_ANGAN